ncbi:MAG: GNAT family N-acetyltransferase [Chloroflexi bacterium]|nr:GNAT family N-acetyltransferase [Chloroflexota bacterium]
MITTELISIPNAPAIPSLAFRGFRGESDFPGMVAALNASEATDGVERVITVEDIANNYAHLVNCDLARDVVLAEVNGDVVGYARVDWYKDEAGNTLYNHLAFLRHEWRHKGVGAALLKWAQTRLREVSASLSHTGPRFFQASASETSRGAEALLIKDGYQAVRHGFLMVRPTLDDIPDFPLPAGLEVRPVLPEHYRAIWDANEEAFRDHWGFAPSTEDDYQRWLNDKVIFMPELWKIAWDVETNQVAGQVKGFINNEENAAFNRRRGLCEFISVRRPWRKRGLARALIALTLHEFKERGLTESALGVDTQNLSGALRVYEACGFRPVQRSSTYRKPLT